jgi:hypothetical protein
MRILALCSVALSLLIASAPAARAIPLRVAVFGGGIDLAGRDNAVDEVLATAGFDVTLVTDAELATPGFLDAFDAFVYTRDGTSSGVTLSTASAANVAAYAAPGRRVLLNGNFADAVNPALTSGSDTNIERLFVNSVGWAAETHHGYIGEYTGTAAALTSNQDALAALDLVSGASGKLYATGALGPIDETPQGAVSPVLDGVALPSDPYDVMYGPVLTGVDTTLVLATYRWSGNPAIIAREVVPSDTTPPVITPQVVGTVGGGGWYTSDVAVTWEVADPESAVTSTLGCDPSSVFADTDGVTFTCTATSAGGIASASVTIRRDATAPVLHVSGAPDGSTVDACAATPARPTFAPVDPAPGSGLATQADTWTPAGTSTGAGVYTYTATATDAAGWTTTETRTYRALYGSAFSGFLQPKADGTSRFTIGATVKVRFRLTCNGVLVRNALNMLAVEPGDTTGNPYVTVPTSYSTPANTFAWDNRGQQYLFDLSTKTPYLNPGAATATTFVPGIYTLRVLLDDGTSRAVTIRLIK